MYLVIYAEWTGIMQRYGIAHGNFR